MLNMTFDLVKDKLQRRTRMEAIDSGYPHRCVHSQTTQALDVKIYFFISCNIILTNKGVYLIIKTNTCIFNVRLLWQAVFNVDLPYMACTRSFGIFYVTVYIYIYISINLYWLHVCQHTVLGFINPIYLYQVYKM